MPEQSKTKPKPIRVSGEGEKPKGVFNIIGNTGGEIHSEAHDTPISTDYDSFSGSAKKNENLDGDYGEDT